MVSECNPGSVDQYAVIGDARELNDYIVNRGIQKLYPHFANSILWKYQQKSRILWKAEAVEKVGGADKGKAGEDLTFAEQMERKAERAGAEHYKKREDWQTDYHIV